MSHRIDIKKDLIDNKYEPQVLIAASLSDKKSLKLVAKADDNWKPKYVVKRGDVVTYFTSLKKAVLEYNLF